MAAILFVCRRPRAVRIVWRRTEAHPGMTGAGDGMTVFDPPRAHPVSPPITRTKKCAARRGKSHRGAQRRTRGNCSQLIREEQGLCQLSNQLQNKDLGELCRLIDSDGNCHFGASASKDRQLRAAVSAERPARRPGPAPAASRRSHAPGPRPRRRPGGGKAAPNPNSPPRSAGIDR